MSFFYIYVGIDHFNNPNWYVRIVPPIFPYKLEVVYFSGVLEILFGVLLLIKRFRFFASWGLIVLLLSVYPANVYLAVTNGTVLDISSAAAWLRLPFQFLFIALAYWHLDIEN
tara:strand:- start:33 stop:371 length:339 start_codon:yes stop_codon:yes gene_type:complete